MKKPKFQETTVKLNNDDRLYVYKSNELINKITSNLSALEFNILDYLISMIRPTDNIDQIYELKIADYCKINKLSLSGGNYENIRNAIQSIDRKEYYVVDYREEENINTKTRYRWLDFLFFDDVSGTVQVRFFPYLAPFLFKLKRNYTGYKYKYITKLNTRYSKQLYSIFRQYIYLIIQNDHKPYEVYWEIENLKELLAIKPEQFNPNSKFIDKVISPSIKKINENTDLDIDYNTVKKDNVRVSGVMFSVKIKQACLNE